MMNYNNQIKLKLIKWNIMKKMVFCVLDFKVMIKNIIPITKRKINK